VAQLCEIDMEGISSSVASARAFVEATLAAWDLEDLVDTATLLTSELATNAILHARTPFRLSILLDGDLTIEVADGSPDQPAADQADPGAERGRGLQVLNALADRWGTRPEAEGKTVWFSLDLP
jgi:anti-sigma regulatory factor (Ser/Thr protein kinase)